ncbi:MAG: hypothetical protein NVSMB2_23600 [Chloroflexota bacterium]
MRYRAAMRLFGQWVTFVALALVFSGAVSPALTVAAPRQQATDWELLAGTSTGVIRLWTIADGYLVAMDPATGLYVSGDLGETWTTVSLPAGGWGLAPDPTTSSRLYAASSGGLNVTADGGATWTIIRPSASPIMHIDQNTVAVAISPADPNVLYATEPLGSSPLTIWRSTNGGTTWTQALRINQQGSPCQTLVSVLSPHPTDPLRVLTDAGCYAGRNFGTGLSQTFDGGVTWSTAFASGQQQYPSTPVGGAPASPGRWYLPTTPFQGIGPARIQRSDDDMASWSDVLEPGDPSTQNFGGVAIDPDQPDTVYVATGRTASADDTGVRVSYDAGQTWDFLGRQDIGWVNDLVRAQDGTLFAATNEGIWRLLPMAS